MVSTSPRSATTGSRLRTSAGDTAVLVAVKDRQTQSVVDDLLRHALEDVTVVSLHNGVANERHLKRSFARVLGCA